MKGRYEVNLSNKIPLSNKIVKFAFEPVAFHLHKKRDFLDRLKSNKTSKAQEEEAKFKNLIKGLAGLSPNKEPIQ